MVDGSTDFTAFVGERLHQARLARRMSLEDIATRTRVPVRHLDAIERGEWHDLPAPTYSIGFAKAFADVVGLDRQQIGDDLRVEMGGGRPRTSVAEPLAATDPARVPPRLLTILAVLIGLALLAGYGYYRWFALGDVQPQIVEAEAIPEPVAPAPAPDMSAGNPGPAPVAARARTGPVVITATAEVWIQVYERGGKTIKIATLAPGDSYEVPTDAVDPLLRTGRADLLRLTAGGRSAPPIGGGGQTVKDVSLRADALFSDAPAPISVQPR